MGLELKTHKGRLIHVRATGQAEEAEVEHVRTVSCQCKPYRGYTCPTCVLAITGKETR